MTAGLGPEFEVELSLESSFLFGLSFGLAFELDHRDLLPLVFKHHEPGSIIGAIEIEAPALVDVLVVPTFSLTTSIG